MADTPNETEAKKGSQANPLANQQPQPVDAVDNLSPEQKTVLVNFPMAPAPNPFGAGK
jgi:hypothetical protein